MLGLQYGSLELPWNSATVIGCFLAAGILFILFYVTQYFLIEPTIPLRLFRHRNINLLTIGQVRVRFQILRCKIVWPNSSPKYSFVTVTVSSVNRVLISSKLISRLTWLYVGWQYLVPLFLQVAQGRTPTMSGVLFMRMRYILLFAAWPVATLIINDMIAAVIGVAIADISGGILAFTKVSPNMLMFSVPSKDSD